jgi:hypothetical protein
LGAKGSQIRPFPRRTADHAGGGVTDVDRGRWDARHAVADDVVPLPPEALRGREDLASTSGRALDLASGRGAVALWLAGRGLAVDAVDVSPVGLEAGPAEPPTCPSGGGATIWTPGFPRPARVPTTSWWCSGSAIPGSTPRSWRPSRRVGCSS